MILGIDSRSKSVGTGVESSAMCCNISAGFAVLIPVLPIVVTNFFAQRRSGGEIIDCSTFAPTLAPPACQVRSTYIFRRNQNAPPHQIREPGNELQQNLGATSDSPVVLILLQNAHSDSVTWSSYTSFISQAIVGFLLSPCIGRWSDQYGRKPFLVVRNCLFLSFLRCS